MVEYFENMIAKQSADLNIIHRIFFSVIRDINKSQFAWRQWQVGPTRSHSELGSETA